MDKKVKVSAIVAALLAVAPVASSVAINTSAPSVVQAASKKVKKTTKKATKKSSKKTTKNSEKIAGYSISAYKKATSIIPKKNIKLSAKAKDGKKYSQTLKAGVMYDLADIGNGRLSISFEKKHYNITIMPADNPDDYWHETSVSIKASDVVPFSYRTDKNVKKYIDSYKNFVKKQHGDYYVGYKFKKNTTVYVVGNDDNNNVILSSLDQIGKKYTVKKNKIIGSDDMGGDVGKENIIKYKGKYYFPLDGWGITGYVPADSVTFVRLKPSQDNNPKYAVK